MPEETASTESQPPVAPKTQRAPRPVTAEEIKDLAEAMADPKNNKNLSAAGRSLAYKYPENDDQRWRRVQRHSTFLSAANPANSLDRIAVPDDEVISRGPLQGLLSPAEQDEVNAMVKQEQLLAESDWAMLGLDSEQAAKMVSMERFSRLPLKHMVRVTHGGMMKGFAGLNSILDTYLDRLKKKDLPMETDKDGNPKNTEREWVHTLVAVSAELRNMKGQVDKSNMLLLKAEQIAREMAKNSGGVKRRGKFASPPLVATSAAATATVVIDEQK